MVTIRIRSRVNGVLVKDIFKFYKIIKDDAGHFKSSSTLAMANLALSPNKNPKHNTFFTSLTDLIDLSHPVFETGNFNCVLNSLLHSMQHPF